MAPKDTSATQSSDEHSVRAPFAEDDAEFRKLKMKLFEKARITAGAKLGSGTFSVVLRAIGHNQEPLAIKVIDTRDGGDYVKRFLPRERELVRSLTHANVVRVFEVLYDTPFVIFVTELCEGGDLLQKILNMTRIPEVHSKPMFRQLTAALEYLERLNIVHRDLKCENIFLDSNDNVKLGDFGFARLLKEGDYSNTFCGSRAYVAPEVLSAQTYTGYATDIWSAGIVLFVMVSGLMPFDDRDPRRMLRKQTAHSVKFPKDVPLSREVKQLILEMLHPVPTHRPTARMIACSRWLKGTEAGMKTAPIDNSR